MTDTINATPGCEWCVNGLQADGETPCPCTVDTIPREEAERMAQARVTAALREALEVLDDEGWLGLSRRRIEALIPDAGGAFDRAIAEAVQAEREAVVRSMTEAHIYALECYINRHKAFGNDAVVEALREMLDHARADKTEGEG